jgi:hypothetical protein
MDYILAMTFLTEAGEKNNFSISGVKPNLTQDQVNTLMDTIISKNVFITKSGALVKKSGAHITEKNVTKFDIV